MKTTKLQRALEATRRDVSKYIGPVEQYLHANFGSRDERNARYRRYTLELDRSARKPR